MKPVAVVNGLWLIQRRLSRKGYNRSACKGHRRPTRKSTKLKIPIVQFVNVPRP